MCVTISLIQLNEKLIFIPITVENRNAISFFPANKTNTVKPDYEAGRVA